MLVNPKRKTFIGTNRYIFCHAFILCITFLFCGKLSAQRDTTAPAVQTDKIIISPKKDTIIVSPQKDTTILKKDSILVKKKRNIFQFAYRYISRKHPDTSSAPIPPALVVKSEQPFKQYEGKIIRHIDLTQFGFGRSFTDTSKQNSRYFGTRLLNKLHRNTRSWQVRNNLFIHEGMPLNTFVLSENERYLRSLDYIQDARILVLEIPGSPDSVDLKVVTKDLFSITGSVSNLSPNKMRISVSEQNLFGTGQKIQGTALYEKARRPAFGSALLYNINNINGSFINASFLYSIIDNNIANSRRNEKSVLLQLDRPLTSAYGRMAGGLTVGVNQSNNDYLEPDSLFYQYKYNIVDGWVGYNLGVKRFLADNNMRDRKFVSIRYFRNNFIQLPKQIEGHYNQWYNDKKGILAQFTFFKQEFYKTNYYYGFGVTEDIPTGYNIAVTSGWYQQSNEREGVSRPYAGVDANYYRFSPREHFIQYFLRAGGFMNRGSIEDAGLLLGTSVFSRLYVFRSFKMRQYLRLSYTRQFNQVTLDPLKINNPFGIRYFGSDSVYGDKRVSLHGETFLFMKYKAFGFQFSPFFFNDVAMITPRAKPLPSSRFYWSIGGGIRTRNNNLLFGTMEVRFVYIPRTTPGMNPYLLKTTINLRFRYNTNYVRAPDLIQLNADYSNSIF